MLEVQRIDGEPVSLHIGRREFEVEEETGYVTVPKEFLTGFRLSDIPADIIIKPADKIEGHTIHITNAMWLFHSSVAGLHRQQLKECSDASSGMETLGCHHTLPRYDKP
jgi:hypothetical protein